MSNWDNTNLDQNQRMYAATDAFVSVVEYEYNNYIDTIWKLSVVSLIFFIILDIPNIVWTSKKNWRWTPDQLNF